MIFSYLLLGGKWSLFLLLFSWLSSIAYVIGFLFTRMTIKTLSRFKFSEELCRYMALSFATFLSLGVYFLIFYWIL
jgi:hypothetical protein